MNHDAHNDNERYDWLMLEHLFKVVETRYV